MKTTHSLNAEDIKLRMQNGETLQHGLAPGERQKRSWWLWPSLLVVPDSVVEELRGKEPSDPSSTMTI